jgi:hypothetical protein
VAHPHRKEVHASQNAKCKAIADPLDSAVDAPDAPSWNEYGASKPVINNKYGSLGSQAPKADAANISRMLNRNPKEFG